MLSCVEGFELTKNITDEMSNVIYNYVEDSISAIDF